jgi:predicted RNA-binding Zn-ribbon protein involved in translation (DUF1610 family)
MAAPVEQTGVIIACPQCGTEVLQKSMIPIGVVDSTIHYLCVPCARMKIATGTETKAQAGTAAQVDPA